MKRSEALASLSRDHHHALVVAQKLRRATDATARQARDAFLTYWTGHGREHFRLEQLGAELAAHVCREEREVFRASNA
jgi:hypothetical protein